MVPPPAPPPPTCRLCLTALEAGAARCPACGLHQAREMDAETRRRLALGFAAVYVVVAVLVALTS